MTDVECMQRALDLAKKGIGRTNPNPAVGCVIVKNDRIIGEGWHRRCGGPHAEILALRNAGAGTSGATMFLTLEPCYHQGRTPPCVDAVSRSGVKRVVIAMPDPNPKVRGRSIKKLRSAGIPVETGVLEQEAREINRPFIKWITSRIPLVTIKTAQTMDGKIASSDGQSKWITSESARKYTRTFRNQFDAILVGINTVLSDEPELNPGIHSKPWTKIVLDSRLRIPLNAKLFRDFKTIVVATETRGQKATRLKRQGVEVLSLPVELNGRFSFETLLKELGKREITNVLIEGGSGAIGSALKEKAADRFLTVIAPKIIGDQQAVSAVDGLKIKDVNKAVRLEVEKVSEIGGDWVFEGNVRY
ncbi:MAG: bifunctional diaminohydroxyphosphoribosylaminopyrimidine deaminase/5-amino-6-(5-phosphoribosylamino)uracil reductase RibD [Candidatus Omnitrophota bacterium]